MPRTGVQTVGRTLVALGSAEFVGLGVEHVVKDVLDRLANFDIQVRFHFPRVEREDSLQVLPPFGRCRFSLFQRTARGVRGNPVTSCRLNPLLPHGVVLLAWPCLSPNNPNIDQPENYTFQLYEKFRTLSAKHQFLERGVRCMAHTRAIRRRALPQGDVPAPAHGIDADPS